LTSSRDRDLAFRRIKRPIISVIEKKLPKGIFITLRNIIAKYKIFLSTGEKAFLLTFDTMIPPQADID
jgi:uncharacterized protein YtpQ (UPF0354 family)